MSYKITPFGSPTDRTVGMVPGVPRPSPIKKSAKRTASTPTPAARDAMLAAAERVVERRGIGGLTLEAVAREADLSKSGLIHHFRTKDALIDALVVRWVGEWHDECEEAIAAQPPGPGRIPRAFLNKCLASPDKWNDAMRQSCSVLVAALVHDPKRVDPLRRMHRDLSDRIARDQLPPGVGEAVMLAVDGLWFDWLFGITELTPAKLANIRAALGSLIELSINARDTARPAPKRQSTVRKPTRRKAVQS